MTRVDTAISDHSPSHPHAPWCEVRLYGQSIRYRRLGTGKPLILVTTRAMEDALWPAVMQTLSGRHRIYIPEVPASRSEFNSWLRSFMEGVGAESTALVAEGELCIPALEFALADTDRVERLLLVPSGSSEETGLGGALNNENGASTLPIFVLRREHPDRAATEIVGQFFDKQRRTP